jgi:hypothetical protein
MTSDDPRQGTQAATPEGGKHQAAAIRQPQDRNGRRPEFVIEIWASPQLRAQDPGRPPSLCEALGRGPATRREPEPDLEPEAEP